MLRRTDFAFTLPEQLIASYPTSKRTESRLLVLNGNNGAINHHVFTDFPDFLNPGDLLILNNTRVFPARLYGKKATGGKLEILIERLLNNEQALVHCKASKRPKIGEMLYFKGEISAKVIGQEKNLLILAFLTDLPLIELLQHHGHIPLPLYIKRPDEPLDRKRYQTVYAKDIGSVAAPTAGLHFDKAMLLTLQNKGVEIAYVTLHIGAGTFQPVRVDALTDHEMHAEYAVLSEKTCEKIIQTKERGGRIIAVGTTTTRTLETAVLTGKISPFSGETRLFIHPGFKFQCIDAMLTNFHLPESSLIMLVCAFGGYEDVMKAYKEAVEQQYRFFSYGDAMFITRKSHAI